MTSKTKIKDVLLGVKNESYLQKYIKPTTSDYFIMTDDEKNDVLGRDGWIGSFYSDNRDGLKEGFALVPFFHIDDDFRYSHYRCISYPSKKTALEVLERLKPKLKEYFGCDKWVVKRTKPHWCHGVINSTIHDLSKEYYKCSKCGLWRCKEFVDHTLSETTYSAECPIEQEVLKSAKTVIQ